MTTLPWRTLEREIISILKENHFDLARDGEDHVIKVNYDYPMVFSLTTFAKELAKRLDAMS